MVMSFIARLQQHLAAEPFTKKNILASSRAQGLQWLEQITRSSGKVEHTEVQTVDSFVLQHMQPVLFEHQLRYVDSQQMFWIVQRLLVKHARQRDALIPERLLSPGMVQRFADAILDLRRAGLRSNDLHPSSFESQQKGELVQTLLAGYEQYTAQNNWADLFTLVSLISETENPIPDPSLLIIPEHVHIDPLQQTVLDLITGREPIVLPCDPSFTDGASGFPAEHSSFFHATGTLAEVRAVFRPIAERNLSCDQVEILISNPREYEQAVYHLAQQLELPCSFAGGLPIGVTRAGKAAQVYLQWMASNFHADPFVQAFRQGIVQLTEDQEAGAPGTPIPGEVAADALEQSGVGWGQERYLLLKQKAEREDDVHLQPVLLRLHSFFSELLRPYSDGQTTTPAKIWSGLVHFLRRQSFYTESDHSVLLHCEETLEAMWDAADHAMAFEQALAYVHHFLDRIHCEVQPLPQPGRLFISTLQNGGQSGRPYTFILGMDEAAWNLRGRQDPVLLDEERQQISRHLLPSTELMQRRLAERNSRLALISGQVTLSCCTYHIAGNEERNPAFEMLQVFRNKTANPQAAMTDLMQAMGKPQHYSDGASLSIDTTDAWMKQLIDSEDRIIGGSAAMQNAVPFLSQGEAAEQKRMDLDLTEYDGLLDTSTHPIRSAGSTAKPLSASRLEMFANCPLKFFYQSVLGIYPKERAAFDRSEWLNPLQRGTLFHSIFEQYMKELRARYDAGIGQGEKINALPHDIAHLRSVTEQQIAETAQIVPAPSEAVFQKECDQIRRDVVIFYQMESNLDALPVFFELAIHSEQEPFLLDMGEDLTLPMRGYIDRIDETAPHQYKIYDYKTGSVTKYHKHDYFGGGTLLQHALYAWAAEQWLRRSGSDPEAEVSEAAYVFPTEKGAGQEVTLPQNKRKQTQQLLQHMLKAMEQGTFPPTDDARQCEWCDFQTVCGNHAVYMKEKHAAMEDDARFSHLLEVQRYD